MQKIVINNCYGGFGLSDQAVELYAQLAGITLVAEGSFGFTNYYRDSISDTNYFCYRDIPRDCPHLIQVLETLGQSATGQYADLKVVEVPDGVEWHIAEYDGMEWVAENHRKWS